MLPNKLQEAVKLLKELWDNSDGIASWALRQEIDKVVGIIEDPKYLYSTPFNVEDVYMVARERHSGIELSEEDAIQILDNMSRSFDPTIGINWDVMEVHIDNYLEGRGQ